jgi:imidazole glycerol-phosphate synthase subunit HisF
MAYKRIIISIDTRDGERTPDASGAARRGDPAELAARMEQAGADEIMFVDVSTSAEGRNALLEMVRRAAARVRVPLTVGGGILDVTDVEAALNAGAAKVSVDSAAVQRPAMITEAAMRFGKERIVASIETRLEKRSVENAMRSSVASTGLVATGTPESDWYRVYTHQGGTATMLDAISWSQQCVQLGAGEILLTSFDRDGSTGGYDLELTARVVEGVSVPVIASGGARTLEHVRDAFLLAGADAAMTVVESAEGIAELKRTLAAAGVPVRLSASA